MTEPMLSLDSTVATAGIAIPKFGLGTWPMKGEGCVAAVSTALRLGYRMIDTAAMYGNEAEVGEGIRASGLPRESVFVTTKVWYTELADGALQKSAEESLARLRLDRLDLLLIHWPDAGVALSETIGALCSVQERGLARGVGISNFPARLVDQAARLARVPLVANQCEYHPELDQTAVIEACRRHDMAFVSYRPLGSGLASDAVVAGIARRLGRTPAQVTLRWHLQQDSVAAVPKSGDAGRIAENAALFDFSLSADDMAAISALRTRHRRLVNPGWAPQWDRPAA